jgi:hypothetical protein
VAVESGRYLRTASAVRIIVDGLIQVDGGGLKAH